MTTRPAEELNANSPDEILVEECLEGREDAWSALIDKYRNLIFSIPIRHGLSRDEASDVFQEVCLTLLSHLSKLREPRSLAAWLIQIASHECSRRRRKQLRYSMTAVEADDPCLLVPPGTGDGFLVELEREQTLREAVTELGARCRMLIDMLFFTAPSVPYQQAARNMGVAKDSVGFIRMRCLDQLMRILKKRGFQ